MDPQLQRIIMMAIFGIVAGTLAGMLVGHPRGGIIGSMIAGLLGSIVGGFLYNALNVKFSLGNAIADNVVQAAIGAVVVLLIAKLL